jgi:hypothetical protein
MINALHLLWIVPLSASFGCFIMALMKTAEQTNPLVNNITRGERKSYEIT